jgi:hypothetical protein
VSQEAEDLRKERTNVPPAGSPKPGRDLFDVPEGHMRRSEALLQIFFIPGVISVAGILIALISRCS